MRHLVNAMMYY